MKSAIFKTSAVVAGALVATILPLVSINAANDTVWGPSRPTITLNGNDTHGFDHVQFNSITNTPGYGDERTFLDAKDASITTSGGFTDQSQVKDGETLTIRTYVHNNADSSLNASGAGIAKNTKVTIQLPTGTVNASQVTSIISADNATPGSVFDTTAFNGATPFKLDYVAGSAMQYTNAVAGGIKLSDNIVTTGAPIGYDKADGNVPGCYQYSSYVTIKVKVSMPSLSLTKQVTTVGGSSTSWASNLNAKVGDTDSWLLTIKNTSAVTVKNATIKDQLPAHLKLVPGSVSLIDGSGTYAQSDTGLFGTNGQNIGDFAPGAVVYIKYKTTVLNDFASTDCNDVLKNIAVVNATGITPVFANGTVTVARNCTTTPPTKPTPPTTPVTPVTPTLPDTGAEAGLVGVGGLSAMAYAGRAYLTSKKSLRGALRK